jgi:hypothetical protein
VHVDEVVRHNGKIAFFDQEVPEFLLGSGASIDLGG